MGSSDITALHEAVAHHLGIVSILGPMPASEMFTAANPDDASVVALRNLLFDDGGPLRLIADGPVISTGERDRCVARRQPHDACLQLSALQSR